MARQTAWFQTDIRNPPRILGLIRMPRPSLFRRLALTLAFTAPLASAFVWDYAGQRIVNQLATSTEGKAFVEEQLLRGGAMLSAVWTTAWTNATPDTYLKNQLLKRASSSPPATPAPAP